MPNMKWNSYFTKLFATYVLILAIPVSVLGIFSYVKTSELVIEKVAAGNAQLLEQTKTQTEQILRSIERAINQFSVASQTVTMINSEMSPDRFSSIHDIVGEMNKLQSYEMRIRDIALVNFEYGWVIRKGGIAPLHEAEDEPLLRQRFSVERNSYWVLEQSDPETGGGSHLLLVKKLPLPLSKPIGMIVSKTPVMELENLLLPKHSSGELFIVDEQGNVILSESEITWNTVQQALLSSEMKALSGSFELPDHRYSVTYTKSDYNGWTYYSVMPVGEITSGTDVIAKLVLITCLAVFGISILLSFIGSKHMYRPIGRLYHMIIGRQGEESSGRADELQLISNNVLRMIDKHSRLTTQLSLQFNQLKEYFFIKLIQGEWNREQIADRLDLFEKPVWDIHYILSLQIDGLERSRFERSDLELLLFAVQNMTSEIVPDTRRLGPVLFNQSVVLLWGREGSDDHSSKEVVAVAERIRIAVMTHLQVDVSVGISRSFTEMKSVARAYKESLEALNYRITFGSGSVLLLEELNPDQRQRLLFPREIEIELLEAIRRADSDKAHQLLDELVDNVTSVQKSTYREYQMALMKLLMNVLELENDCEPETGASTSEVFDEFFNLKSANDIKVWMWARVVKPLIGRLEEARKKQYTNISENMKRLVHERYDTDLTLEVCAAELNFSPDYLRQVFRKKNGITFSDYLARHRLMIAKEMLVNTSATITEISEKLNYQNPQNFIRYFRRMENMTPGQYREKHQGGTFVADMNGFANDYPANRNEVK